MKDIIIIGLIGYILYDRYIRERNVALLKEDAAKLTAKAEELINTVNEKINRK